MEEYRPEDLPRLRTLSLILKIWMIMSAIAIVFLIIGIILYENAIMQYIINSGNSNWVVPQQVISSANAGIALLIIFGIVGLSVLGLSITIIVKSFDIKNTPSWKWVLISGIVGTIFTIGILSWIFIIIAKVNVNKGIRFLETAAVSPTVSTPPTLGI